MTAPPPRRPSWRRKRTWASLALWLLAAYPLSLGPIVYSDVRGWMPRWAAVYAPYRPFFAQGTVRPIIATYVGWWSDAADRHRAASE